MRYHAYFTAIDKRRNKNGIQNLNRQLFQKNSGILPGNVSGRFYTGRNYVCVPKIDASESRGRTPGENQFQQRGENQTMRIDNSGNRRRKKEKQRREQSIMEKEIFRFVE